MSTEGSSRLLFFISFILIHLVKPSIAQQPNFHFLFNTCSNSGNYSSNSTYKANLDTLLSSINNNTKIDHYGFYNFSKGISSDKVNAIALCRGDVTLYECRRCVNDSTHKLTQICPNQKEAIGWHDYCMLRYSDRSIFGTREGVVFYMRNPKNVSNSSLDHFNTAVANLLRDLKSRAASGDSLRKFATGTANFTSFQLIYGLVQCIPDLSEVECHICLDDAISQIPTYCNGAAGGRLVGPSCYHRYELYKFYESTADAPPPPSLSPPLPPSNTTATTGNGSKSSQTVIVAVISTVSSVIIIVCGCMFLRMRKPKEKVETRSFYEAAESMDEIRTVESLQFDFGTIRVSTDNFSDANKLGEGGFGAVYKGTLSDGQDIAVKRLSMDSGQGELEFKNEVLLVAKLQHRNLVRLLGFCLKGKERLLIYEFVPNTSLDHFIFDPIKRGLLDWERRYKIIGGIARGLLYLHEDSQLRIIHRDLKASNILLDAEMTPKISDFGMARLFVMDQTQGSTSRIVGTYGYMAPEYVRHGYFSGKSDVYSFGVVVLEIVSGQKNSSFHYGENSSFRNGENIDDLISFAWKCWREGTTSNVMDPTLTVGSRNEMMRCIHIALLCVQENIANRPTMASVILMLSSYSLSLPLPLEPGFFSRSSMDLEMRFNSEATESDQFQKKSAHFSENEASITELEPR